MNAVLTRITTLILLSTFFAGCATTGDPTQGGLLGWSEDKAKARRADLEQEAYEARQRAEAAQKNQNELDVQERELIGTVGGLEAKLTKLMAENTKLRKSFTKLMEEQATANEELVKLQAELDRTDREFSSARPVSFAEERAERVNAQNKRLNSAILLMLQQR